MYKIGDKLLHKSYINTYQKHGDVTWTKMILDIKNGMYILEHHKPISVKNKDWVNISEDYNDILKDLCSK